MSSDLHELKFSILLSGAEAETFGPAGADKFLTKLRATTVSEDGVK
ncbi:hypothetical protein [Arthrobacter sp. MYb227]|nr:hypothetical protein [Arthrobacter sp. MYb227]